MNPEIIKRIEEFSKTATFRPQDSLINGQLANAGSILKLLMQHPLHTLLKRNVSVKCNITNQYLWINLNLHEVYYILKEYMEKNPVYIKCIEGSRKGTVGRLNFTQETEKVVNDNINENIKNSKRKYDFTYFSKSIPFTITFDNSKKSLNGLFPRWSSDGKFSKNWILSFDDEVTNATFEKKEKSTEPVTTDYKDFFGNSIEIGDILFGSIGTVGTKRMMAARLIKITPSGLLKVQVVPLKQSHKRSSGDLTYLLSEYAAGQVINTKHFKDIEKHILFLVMKYS